MNSQMKRYTELDLRVSVPMETGAEHLPFHQTKFIYQIANSELQCPEFSFEVSLSRHD